ncbi:hypothetical protein KYC5002_39450 [Archangium violaceum]|uniref:hypothetical protein n=1 Tax=Archangium violaceum TaxID=83451 RepID=UPI002B31A8A9|nr:hypothetical protein KYC5002_39450 [Archangium gephyra]
MIGKYMALVLALAVTTPVLAQDSNRTERVEFASGATSKELKGSIKGYETVSYLVGARAGQVMTVTLKTSNTSSYFNITAPGADTALYQGDVKGNEARVELPSNGDYRIMVYMMRNAARRKAVAKYTLKIGVE